MPKYIPLELMIPIKASQSDLLEFKWIKNGIEAYFIIPYDEKNALRIYFDRVEIVRILDEMPLSTENETKNEGLVRDHVAYLVQDSSFWQNQSDAFKQVYKAVQHYRFITGWTCLDVISGSEPSFTIAPAPISAFFEMSDSGKKSIDALSLDDTLRWSSLQTAYGSANDVPSLLRQLAALPASNGTDEPWYSLWSSLAHQGDVYSASFAAVPHVIRALSIAPSKADSSFFHFPAWIEICRQKTATPIPEDLRQAYFDALARLPSLVAVAADREWDGSTLACILSAIAAAKGYGGVAEAAQELTPDVATEFMEWFFKR